MRRGLLIAIAFVASLFATNSHADVEIYIGGGKPDVILGSTLHGHHYPDLILGTRQDRPHHYRPVRPRHFSPPVYFYPERVYRGHKYYRSHKYYQARPNHYHHVKPRLHNHLRHGHRPPPPHAHARGHWSRW